MHLFNFGWAPPQTRRGAYSATQTFWLDLTGLLLRDGRRKGVEWNGRGEGWGGNKKEEKRRGPRKLVHTLMSEILKKYRDSRTCLLYTSDAADE